MEVWKRIFDILTNAGFKVYPPAQHKGEAKETYVVLKDDLSVKILQTASTQHNFSIYIHTPFGKYVEFLDTIELVKMVLKEQQEVVLKMDDDQLPSITDDTTNAYVKQLNINTYSY